MGLLAYEDGPPMVSAGRSLGLLLDEGPPIESAGDGPP